MLGSFASATSGPGGSGSVVVVVGSVVVVVLGSSASSGRSPVQAASDPARTAAASQPAEQERVEGGEAVAGTPVNLPARRDRSGSPPAGRSGPPG